MTVQTTPYAIQSGGETAESYRRVTVATYVNPGIVRSGDLAVTAQLTPNMTVRCDTGQVVIPGTESTYQGYYHAENRGSISLTVDASDPTNPRRDFVVARVRDAAYSGATNSFVIEVITGTPAAAALDPAIPSNAWVLARINVAAGATSITNAVIDDLRTSFSFQKGRATTLGGTIICTSGSRPAAPTNGIRIYETDTKREYVYDGSAWIATSPLGRIATTVRTSNSVTFSSVVYPNSVAANLLPNRRIRVRVHVNLSSTVAGTNVSIGVANSVGTILNQAYCTLAAANASQQMTVEYETTSGAGGSTTFQISAFTAANTAVITGSGTAASYLTVFDDGPA